MKTELRSDEAFWISNFTRWILGEDEKPTVLRVRVSVCSLRQPLVRVMYGRKVRWLGYSELASSKARLKRLINKWEAVINA